MLHFFSSRACDTFFVLTRSINVSFELWFLSSVVRVRDDRDTATQGSVRYAFRDTFGQYTIGFIHIS
jgi:hypothetical protein